MMVRIYYELLKAVCHIEHLFEMGVGVSNGDEVGFKLRGRQIDAVGKHVTPELGKCCEVALVDILEVARGLFCEVRSKHIAYAIDYYTLISKNALQFCHEFLCENGDSRLLIYVNARKR